ncbi:PA14 domain-containing protein [Streptomyces lydicus]|uniref:fibronectin type III domain-containing protein n=1 Tax=Streptomyces lydicus TaxID=47763 RepID=UPI002E36398B|nr:PA14 domain-containing protein [Streptomyces lydicus]
MNQALRAQAVVGPRGRRTAQTLAAAVVLAATGGLLTVTAGTAEAAVTCTSPAFKRTFYANTMFSGTPKKTDCDSVIDQNWGTGAPATGLPADYFGVRWTVTRDFGSGGPFQFAAEARDGIRVYLDGVRKIDLWKNVSTTQAKTANVTVPSGSHTLRIDYVNWTGAANVKFTYTPRTSADTDKVKPLTPTGTSLSYSSYSAKFSWAANKEMDLAGYRVYRSTGKPVAVTAANLVSGSAPVSGAGYREALPQTGDWYYYVVTAVDTHGNESAPSGTTNEFMTQDRTPPAETALNARAEESEAGITLTWDASEATSEDFVGYRVYRSSAPRTEGKPRELVGEHVQGTSFTDRAATPGTTYHYWVVAADEAGCQGTPSVDMEMHVQGNTTAPPAVSGVTVTPGKNGVSLSWDASDDPGLDHYKILRGTLVDGQWTYQPLLNPGNFQPWEFTVTQHHDLTPADGEQVRYAVVAVDQYGNALTPDGGATTAEVTEVDLRPDADATPAATGAPLTSLGAHSYGDHGWVGWILSPEADGSGRKATGFHVYRWNPDTRVFDKLTATPVPREDSGYWDTAMPQGTTSFYRVTVVLSDGTETGATQTAVAAD